MFGHVSFAIPTSALRANSTTAAGCKLKTCRRCIAYSCLLVHQSEKRGCACCRGQRHSARTCSCASPGLRRSRLLQGCAAARTGLAHEHRTQFASCARGSGLCRVAVRGGRLVPWLQVLARAHGFEQAAEERVALAHQLQHLRG